MSKNTFIILMILVVPLVVYFALTKDSANTSVEAQVKMPQMIKFTSRMCYDCQKLEEVVKEVYPHFKDRVRLTEESVQDNSSATQTMIKKYHVKLVPTSIFLDKNGEIKKEVEGTIDKATLEQYLSEISNNG